MHSHPERKSRDIVRKCYDDNSTGCEPCPVPGASVSFFFLNICLFIHLFI